MRGPPTERSLEDRLAFGVVCIDKPTGPSSHQVAAWVRDALGVDRAAHAGTLDPKVTGVLPVLLSAATRCVPAMVEAPKEYVAVCELHGDPVVPLETVLEQFTGPLYQKPPRKSAVARRLRERTVYALEQLERDGRRVLLRIRCASGTYIRKLCHDIGLAAGCGAHMGDLRRTASGPFDDTALVTTTALTDALATDAAALDALLLPGEAALAHLPRVTIAESAAATVADGAPVFAPGVRAVDPTAATPGTLVACVTPDEAVVCLGRTTAAIDDDHGEAVRLAAVLV
jgi:tRNA pseudouridine55 synthase